MAFKALDQVFDPRLPLPGSNGKTYYVPEADAELGTWATAVVTAGMQITMGEEPSAGAPPLQLDDSEENALYKRILGETWDALEADGYGYATQKFFAQTGLIWIALGGEAAEAFWNSGGDPKASMTRSARRARRPASTTTAVASMTRPRGSTSGTKSRKGSSKP